MSDIQIKTSSDAPRAAKRSRYEKQEVGYGQITVNSENSDIVLGDTAYLGQFPIKEIIHGRFVTDTDDELEIFAGSSDTDTPITWVVDEAVQSIDYVVSYIKGTGHPGSGHATDGAKGVKLAVLVQSAAPVVNSKSATPGGVPGTTCDISASVASKGSASTVTVSYGLTTGYGTTTAFTTNGTIDAGTTGNTTCSITLTGLTAATTYHYRVTITNTAGTVNSTDGTFTTAAAS